MVSSKNFYLDLAAFVHLAAFFLCLFGCIFPMSVYLKYVECQWLPSCKNVCFSCSLSVLPNLLPAAQNLSQECAENIINLTEYHNYESLTSCIL